MRLAVIYYANIPTALHRTAPQSPGSYNRQYHAEGLSYRLIWAKLGISVATVSRS